MGVMVAGGEGALAAMDAAGIRVIALSNEGDVAQSIQLDVAWPERFATLKIKEWSASGARTLGAMRVNERTSVFVEPKTILILESVKIAQRKK